MTRVNDHLVGPLLGRHRDRFGHVQDVCVQSASSLDRCLSTEGPRRIKAATAPSIARAALRRRGASVQSSRRATKMGQADRDARIAYERRNILPVIANRTLPQPANQARIGPLPPRTLRALLLLEDASKIEPWRARLRNPTGTSFAHRTCVADRHVSREHASLYTMSSGCCKRVRPWTASRRSASRR